MSGARARSAPEDRGRRFDYTAVGHVTADVMPDGSRRPGGTAFYSALQAARLGARTLILTQGVATEIEGLLEPYRGELALEVLPAAQTTTLRTCGSGAQRRQSVLAWAGPLSGRISVHTRILHLAPVARETPTRWSGEAEFVGLTPQGLIRAWAGAGGRVGPVPLAPALVPERCDAIVFSAAERESCGWLIASRALVAVTAAADATELYLPEGQLAVLEVPEIERSRDDIGAGDVFAAAFFIALLEGRDPRSSAAFANAAAAVRVSGLGASAIGTRSAIEALLERSPT